jgi:uncharacterized membrane protein YheB (UPF0754 family)
MGEPCHLWKIVTNFNPSSYQLWLYLAPPLAGAIVGYFTNDVAIKMLFRPYQAKYIGKFKLPFTPGLIPSNQERLAKRISDTIMGSLLTPEELQKIAKRLLQVERIQAAISWLFQIALDRIQADKEQKTIGILANILQDLLGESLPRWLKVLARKPDFLEPQLNQIFDLTLLDFQLTPAQAAQVSEWLLDSVLPPETIRSALVDFLTDRNIQVIDDGFREKSSGTYWVVANLFGVKNALTRLRTFCLDEREQANRIIAELIISLNVKDRLQSVFCDLSLQNLPLSTVNQLRKTVADSVRSYLQSRGGELIQGMSESIDWRAIAAVVVNRLRNSTVMTASLDVISEELAIIIDRYLERDLEPIVAQIIPILNIDEVIINRVKATSPADLEAGINAIVKTELQGIVNLGGILGLIVGLMQTVILFLQSS